MSDQIRTDPTGSDWIEVSTTLSFTLQTEFKDQFFSVQPNKLPAGVQKRDGTSSYFIMSSLDHSATCWPVSLLEK